MCPLGKVNDDLNITGDTLKDGQPITLPHEFGTPVLLPHEFGNVEPVSDATLYSNPVTWPVSPAHFGNNNPLGAVAATPTFSPIAGAYGPTQNVTISCATAGSTIYYTTDGSTPTTSSPVFSSPIAVASSETLKAFAVAAGYKNSAVGSANYTINGQLPIPTFSPTSETFYTASESVIISESVSGADIYYTTDGSTPTNASAQVVFAQSIDAAATPDRNDFDGSLGITFQINIPIQVTRLGRYYDPSNTQDHPINLWNNTNQVTPIATGTILTSSDSDANGFKWVNITPIILQPGSYSLAVDEFNNGDLWTNSWLPVFSSYLVSPGWAFGAGNSVFPGITKDGADASFSSPALDFSAAVQFSTTTTLKALATKASYSDSLVGSATYTAATPVTVLNPSFENPAQAPGGFNATVTNWTAGGTIGVFYPDGIANPAAFAGNQVLFLAAGANATQATSHNIVAGENYHLNVYVAGRDNNASPSYSFSLTANGVIVATATASISVATWTPVILTWLGDAPHAGQTLGIKLSNPSAGQLFYDLITIKY